MVVYYNDAIFDANHFFEKSVVKESKISSQQISEFKPTFFTFNLQTRLLQDETNVVNLFEQQTTFYGLRDEFFRLQDSAWDQFPSSDKPFDKYKYVSFDLRLVKDLQQISRQTYGLLEWLGDCGGLIDALTLIAKLIINPFSVFTLWQKLAEFLVKIRPIE